MVAVVAPASEVIKRILDFVGIAVGEEVAVGAEVRAKRAEKGVQFACASAVTSGVSYVEFVVYVC